MPADGQTAKFLYTILKQLDLKSVRLHHIRYHEGGLLFSYLLTSCIVWWTDRLEPGGNPARNHERPRCTDALLPI